MLEYYKYLQLSCTIDGFIHMTSYGMIECMVKLWYIMYHILSMLHWLLLLYWTVSTVCLLMCCYTVFVCRIEWYWAERRLDWPRMTARLYCQFWATGASVLEECLVSVYWVLNHHQMTFCNHETASVKVYAHWSMTDFCLRFHPTSVSRSSMTAVRQANQKWVQRHARIRSRMLPTKENRPDQHQNKIRRLCKDPN